MRNDFHANEVSNISGKQFPNVGGRLRLFHTDISALDGGSKSNGVKTEIFKYDDDVAVVQAIVTLDGSEYSGIGMASKARDKRLYPAILELAETRAIARALRFAGYGVEYTGAEEMSHLGKAEVAEVVKPVESTPVEPEIEEPVPHAEGSEIQDAALNLKQEVWKHIVSEWGSFSQPELVKAIQTFIGNIKSKRPDTLDSQIYESILNRRAEFAKSFNNLLDPRVKEEEEPKSDPKVYQEKKEAVAKKLNAVPPTEGPSKTEKMKKAQIFMQLPEGVNANAFKLTLDAIVKENKDKGTEIIYDMILGDFDGFVDMMVSFCAENSIDPGFTVVTNSKEPAPEKVKAPAKVSKKSYNEFRAQWINLTWKPFNTFIIENAEQFQEDKAEYDAAVGKFDRLKDKNDASAMRFPYLFSHTESQVDDDKSILQERAVDTRDGDWAILDANKERFPKMCKVVAGAIGIQDPKDDKELEAFLDEFEHQVTTFEAKNKKPYTE